MDEPAEQKVWRRKTLDAATATAMTEVPITVPPIDPKLLKTITATATNAQAQAEMIAGQLHGATTANSIVENIGIAKALQAHEATIAKLSPALESVARMDARNAVAAQSAIAATTGWRDRESALMRAVERVASIPSPPESTWSDRLAPLPPPIPPRASEATQLRMLDEMAEQRSDVRVLAEAMVLQNEKTDAIITSNNNNARLQKWILRAAIVGIIVALAAIITTVMIAVTTTPPATPRTGITPHHVAHVVTPVSQTTAGPRTGR